MEEIDMNKICSNIHLGGQILKLDQQPKGVIYPHKDSNTHSSGQ